MEILSSFKCYNKDLYCLMTSKNSSFALIRYLRGYLPEKLTTELMSQNQSGKVGGKLLLAWGQHIYNFCNIALDQLYIGYPLPRNDLFSLLCPVMSLSPFKTQFKCYLLWEASPDPASKFVTGSSLLLHIFHMLLFHNIYDYLTLYLFPVLHYVSLREQTVYYISISQQQDLIQWWDQ